jgi:hypothetical protein
MGTVVSYRHFQALQTRRRWEERRTGALGETLDAAERIRGWAEQLGETLESQSRAMEAAANRHHQAERLLERCQEIAGLDDPEEMVRLRDELIREWSRLAPADSRGG